ncbi:hypothetical protein PROFUN_07487 [Planoprotostelium fungivorum]|uniref:CWH43-like N-terminal domain-containing protein n=1 Tax=Planoprotostelium fungivorum TaxID=1890364 RepID=A0A2P6NLJ0_9EUKA|nr:hypothetical protein PROFUN_07487 [Planoprotostelium fungivorum]
MSRFLGYAWAPVISLLVWFATLTALLIWWLAEGHPQYMEDEATIVFISDIGAAHKQLFIPGCAVTATFYVLSLLAERYLRHKSRIPKGARRRERNFAIVSIVACIIAAFGLLFLSIFDAFNHSTAHWILTIVFVVGVAISALFQSLQVFCIKKGHPDRAHLRRNTIFKLVIVSVAIVLAIAFGILYAICKGDAGVTDRTYCNGTTSTAAVLEWTIAYLFDIYLLTLVLDLYPSIKTSIGYGSRHPEEVARREQKQKDLEMAEAEKKRQYNPLAADPRFHGPAQPVINQPMTSHLPASR